MLSPFLWPQNPESASATEKPNPNLFHHIQAHFVSVRAHLLSLTAALHSARSPGPTWARMTNFPPSSSAGRSSFEVALASPDIEERLAGVPVYALSNAEEEFVLVSDGPRKDRSLGLLCFRREDAEAMLGRMRAMQGRGMGQGSKVVAVAFNKVVQLHVNEVAFRFIPDPSQVANAIKEKEKVGEPIYDGFPGVPVFQSKSLVLKSKNKRFRPIFFRKEDLDDSLSKAAYQQNTLNPAFRMGDIQVFCLEDIINSMKASSSKWEDVVFIPPGFDVATDISTAIFG